MQTTNSKQQARTRRHRRIRAKVVGTASRPRLAVYKSNRYLHAQIIDDSRGVTLVSGTTQPSSETRAKKLPTKRDGAVLLGKMLAEQAKAAGITAVVFDRGGFRYTGRVAVFAEAAREAGLIL